MRHNSSHPEIVIEELNCVADFHMLAVGINVVHQNVIRSLKGSSFYVNKGTEGLERIDIDSPDVLQGSRSRNLPYHRRDNSYLRQLSQHIRNLHWDGSIREADY